MQCSKPFRVKNPLAEFNKTSMEVPCGKCTACRQAKTREWTTRLLHEAEYYENNSFVTLTYQEDYLPVDESLNISHLQNFIKRYRKNKEPQKIKYFACGEYGDKNGRPHYHLIIFGQNMKDNEEIQTIWGNGNTVSLPVELKSIRYVAGYIYKKYSGDLKNKVYGEKQQPFAIQSNGLGKRYALEHKKQIMQKLGVTIQGIEVGIPRYYKKLLDINPDDIHENSLSREEKLIKKLRDRGLTGAADQYASRYYSRIQHEKTLIAKNKLYAKGKL